MKDNIELWPHNHEQAQAKAEDHFIDECCQCINDNQENDRNLRYAFWFGWRHCLKHLRDLEDEQEQLIEKESLKAPEYDPDAEEYGPPVSQEIVEHIRSGGTLPKE